MELGTEISQKVKKTIKKQLQTLGSYVDDELPEYIMVMLANKRTRQQMVEDLNLFLNDEAEKFVSWLFIVLERIKKAITLSDIDGVNVLSTESDEEASKKRKKKMKNDDEEPPKQKHDENWKRRFKENNDKAKRKSNPSDKSEIERKQREAKRVDSGKENGRKQSMERRTSDNRDKGRRSEGNWMGNRNPQSRSREDTGTNRRGRNASVSSDENVRKEAEEKAKEIEQRKKNKNPMDFVKQIAKDINQKLIGGTAESSLLLVETSPQNVQRDTKLEHFSSTSHGKLKETKNNDTTESGTLVDSNSHGNVSLQAVEQYGDREIELEKTEIKTERGNNTKDSRKGEITKERRRRRSLFASRTRHRSRSRGRRRARSRSNSPAYHSKLNFPSRSRWSRSREDIMERKRRDSITEKDTKDKTKQEKRRSEKAVRGSDKEDMAHDKNYADSQNVNSQVQLYVDFKRKPALSRTHQASSALLKRAMTEVVTDAVADRNHKSEDEVELYCDDIGDALHEEVQSKREQSLDRRVINFNQRSTGLATITVNFKSNESASDSNVEGDHQIATKGLKNPCGKPESDEEEIQLRKGLLQDMSKVDARYAIMKSRLEHKQQVASLTPVKIEKVDKRMTTTTHGKHSTTKERYIGSMVADLEEKSNLNLKRRKKYERRQDRQRLLESQRLSTSKQKAVDSRAVTTSDSRRKHSRNESSDEEVVLSEHRVKQLTEETRRIKMRELQRSMQVAREGDLRNILKDKQQQQQRTQKSSSDDEEEVERKLREKIKEEKHKRLFGKLNRGERERLQKERDELRRKLEHKQCKRRNSDKPLHHKQTKKLKHKQAEEQCDDEKPDREASDDDEQWVENVYESKQDREDDIVGAGSEQEEAKSTDKRYRDHLRNMNVEEEDRESEENGSQKNEEIQPLDAIEKEERSLGNTQGVEVSAEVMKASVHGGDNDANDDFDGKANVEEHNGDVDDMEGDRENLTANEHYEMVENDEQNNEENKPSKKRKTRHEFIVTLEGYEDSRSKETDIRRKRRHSSDKQQQQQQERRRRSQRIESSKRRDLPSPRTHSDDEFMAIKKSREEECHKTSSRERHRSSRGQKQSKYRTADELHSAEELSEIDREILLAEEKLKTQKLLKKSLEQVQNLNTDDFSGLINSDHRKNKTTAFVNPHFKPKVHIPVVNVLPLNVAGQPIATVQTLPPVSPVVYPVTQMPSYVDMASQPKKIPPQVNVVKPVVTVTTDAAVTTIATSAVPTTTATGEQTTATNQQQQRIQLDQLKNVACKTFPNCSFGNRCLYMHPSCKFAERCTNALCVFNHDTAASSQMATLCKFFPNCKKNGCPYKHVKACHFGGGCKNTDCLYIHEPTSRGLLKWVADKPHISERTFAVDDSDVSTTPVAVTTTSNE